MVKRISLEYLVTLVVNMIVFILVARLFINQEMAAHAIFRLMTLNLAISAIEVGLYNWAFRHRQQPVTAMTHKVEAMLKDEEPAHVLLRKDNDYYELAMAINRLQTHQQKGLRSKAQQGEELRLLLSYLPIGVMVIDRYRKVEMANAAMAEFLQTEIKQRRHPYTQDIHQFELVSLIGQVFSEKKSARKVITLPGMPTEKRVEVSVIYTSTSEDFFQILVLLYDVTEIYAVEKMQMDFLSNASHELKTPVTAISGFAETLQAGAKNDPEALNQFLDIIQKESKRLTELIQDVLSISRIESQSISHQKMSDIDISELVDEQLSTLQQMASVKHIVLVNQIPVGEVQHTDERKVVEIIKNLVSNAIKYNRDNGSVTVDYEATEQEWKLKVTDTGIGIAQNEQARIFERFYRVDTSRTKQVVNGTGLGLAIVMELVQSLQGQISVDSQRGVGSTFSVTFPIKQHQ
ncbi:two-component system sensor histidine kinase [Secundilactobacillus pentosiphilus]|uniref:histidine kinase n=1 Tax=Secundilactobacillus pentosiphilus TaxID=1714682 RepID=A0A1Z5IYH1_9LACO|nr:ATP-binding protein [Secundilactobacillus pentosiphilus]GAX06797.1 two-component system sensor histidine kinase [Secundilactobacillus pentosiphilus]